MQKELNNCSRLKISDKGWTETQTVAGVAVRNYGNNERLRRIPRMGGLVKPHRRVLIVQEGRRQRAVPMKKFHHHE
jgi:hypothetical protein